MSGAALGDVRTLILAGGKGTRLASVVADRPKVLAPVDGRPFLDHLLAMLERRGLRRLVFLLGHRHEDVTAALVARAPGALSFEWVIEAEPLGTGGALRNAAAHCTRDFFLVNGDTFVDFDAAALLAAHEASGAAVTLAAVSVPDAGRYGALDVDDAGVVRAFREKAQPSGPGLINGGVYVVAPRVLELVAPGRAVSLESEVMPALLSRGERLLAVPQPGATFFDIGTPESLAAFARAVAPGTKET